MTTLLEHARKLAEAFPSGGPVYLDRMAEIFWPDADWLKYRVNRHNGGSRRGARVAGALAAKLEKKRYLRMNADTPRNYTVCVGAIKAALEADHGIGGQT